MYLFFRKLLSIVFHIKYKINLIDPQNIPDMKGGYIIASNHLSFADPPMIAAVIRGKFSFMAKEELFKKNPFFAWLIRRCGAFPVTRGAGDDAPIRTSVEAIKKNRILVIFPEGTRSKDGTLGRIKSGVVLIASQAAAPILPVCIRYGEKHRVDIAFGEMIPAEQVHIDENDRHSMRNSSKRIGDSLAKLQKKIYDEAGLPLPVPAKKSPDGDANG
ncbi:MAG: 1-acyl-sn-glycerol-3-phosphate acyltransferase [Ruminiclostridium sp.]|nr:1-acyl-sn-glycerol-3-phosphate acyltransferase [Ruminiclostridium sp.]